MRIIAFEIQNFRGIRRAAARGLGGTIIIAGQNGSGKSCIFDALRLLKSVYGGYQQNEWHHWMGEFAINVNSTSQDLAAVFNQKSVPLSLEFNFELHDEEKAYLIKNIDELIMDSIWRTKLPDAYAFSGYKMAMFASQFRELEPEVRQLAAAMRPAFESELAKPFLTGAVTIQPGGRMNVKDSKVLPVLFTSYRPKELGVIDYHGAQRHYGREQVQNINISLDQTNQVQSAHALYNYANKYANVKSEMAASYMKEVLAEQAGVPRSSQATLTSTLIELFETFFPDKKFLGPVPTGLGGLTFPVETQGGSRHDLDDLSAGEKEILYGYLRIRNSAPRFSIILIDEPELHLNPRLIRGLPQFYRKSLGLELDNQIWLVTHSDALLREAVGKDGFQVFHMQPCGLIAINTGIVTVGMNQLKPLEVKNDVDLALADIVGDLAAFQPDRKVVIFEGGGDSDFDRWMTLTLFPEIYSQYNLISGSNKNKVKALHEVLNRAFDKGNIKTQFYAIVDADYEDDIDSHAINRFVWPVYHIENFLLDASIIAEVVSGLYQNPVSKEDVLEALKTGARSTVGKAIRHRITDYASKQLTGAINLGFDPSVDDVGAAIYGAVARSIARTSELESTGLSALKLQAVVDAAKADIEAAFADGSWLVKLPGRDILRAYSNTLPSGISHETLRLMIVNKMKELNFRPEGMVEIMEKIHKSGKTSNLGSPIAKAPSPSATPH